ncbi:MAG: hypothetical protein WBO47_02570 [Gammaproteobacteria bacterium]
MRKKIILLLIALMLPLGAHAVGYSKVFDIRAFEAEIPPAKNGPSVIKIGVILPRSAEIPKVEVFADRADRGDNLGDWAKCDIDTKKCQVSDARIVRFFRMDHDTWQELSVEIENTDASAARYALLRVTFKDAAGNDQSGCGVAYYCGFSEAASEY